MKVRSDGHDDTRNPELWLKPLMGQGTIAGRVLDAEGNPIPEALVNFHRAEDPDTRWRETWTYASDGVNPDEEWGENFVVGDVPAGSYVLKIRIGGRLYTQEVTVEAGKTSLVIIQTQK